MTEPLPVALRLRRYALRQLHDWGYCLWCWADEHLAAHEPSGPLCPDCRIGPDVGEDNECPICRQKWEDQRVQRTMYDDGYVDGYTEAVQRKRSAD